MKPLGGSHVSAYAQNGSDSTCFRITAQQLRTDSELIATIFNCGGARDVRNGGRDETNCGLARVRPPRVRKFGICKV